MRFSRIHLFNSCAGGQIQARSGFHLKKRTYIVVVSQDEDGNLRKAPVPMRYAYIFLSAAVVGVFTIVGLAGSYSRMLLKTEHFNQIRQEREALRKNYLQMEQVAHEKDVQAASLGSLASEVSALYGLTESKFTAAQARKVQPDYLSAGASADFTSDSYYKSLDQFYALRETAMSGTASRALSAGILSGELNRATSLADWSALAAAPSLWPVQGPVTSTFGERQDPFNGEGAFHSGIDISATNGTVVRAASDGTVIAAGTDNGYGREIILDHGHGIKTLYAHLSGFTVAEGQTVLRGEIIGYVGSSGRATGAHLHYEVRIYDTPVNPHKYLRVTPDELAENPSGL